MARSYGSQQRRRLLPTRPSDQAHAELRATTQNPDAPTTVGITTRNKKLVPAREKTDTSIIPLRFRVYGLTSR